MKDEPSGGIGDESGMPAKFRGCGVIPHFRLDCEMYVHAGALARFTWESRDSDAFLALTLQKDGRLRLESSFCDDSRFHPHIPEGWVETDGRITYNEAAISTRRFKEITVLFWTLFEADERTWEEIGVR